MTLGIGLALCGPGIFAQAPADPYQQAIPRAMTQRLLAARAQKDPAVAAVEFKQLAEANPDYFRAQYNLGLSYIELGDYKQAIAALESALATKQRLSIADVSIYNSLGWAYMLDHDYPRAELNFLQAVELENENTAESNAKLFNNLGLLYVYTARYNEARKNLEIARDRYHNPQAVSNLLLLDAVSRFESQMKRAPTQMKVITLQEKPPEP